MHGTTNETTVTRRFWPWATLILIVAAAWRIAIARAMAVISPDATRYLEWAEGFAGEGWRFLRTGDLEQHPFFPAAIAIVAQILFGAGWADHPETWVRAGQIVTLSAGLGVVFAAGLAAGGIARGLGQRPVGAMLTTMAIAALLPLNVMLSADVMSDEVHAFWLLLGIACAAWLPGRPAALAVGCCAGLAFLVRPEGAALLLAGLAALLLVRGTPLPGRLAAAGLIVLAFLAIATPYWLAIGSFSPKVEKQTTEEVEQVAAGEPAVARLVRARPAWYETPALATLELLRAGRVVIPVAALAGVLPLLRRPDRWRHPALSVPAGVALLLFAAAHLLLERHGYLDPRHLLIPTNIAVLAAGVTLAGVWRRSVVGGLALSVVIAVPLATYALRVPNGADWPLGQLGRWLREQPRPEAALLLGGSTERRIAFYADMPFQQWPENLADVEQRLVALREHLVGFRATHFAIVVGPPEELAENRLLVGRLAATSPGLLTPLRSQAADRDREILLFRVDPDGR